MDRGNKHFRVGHTSQLLILYAMKNTATIRLSSDMNFNDIANEIKNLGGSKARLQQDHRFENGIEVIYLRPATRKEKIITALMSKTMRMEQALPAYQLILKKAESLGLKTDSIYLQNIKKALNSGGDLKGPMLHLRDFCYENNTTSKRFSLAL
jgi:hypothetical protein